jgi:hypothetical protein
MRDIRQGLVHSSKISNIILRQEEVAKETDLKVDFSSIFLNKKYYLHGKG